MKSGLGEGALGGSGKVARRRNWFTRPPLIATRVRCYVHVVMQVDVTPLVPEKVEAEIVGTTLQGISHAS